MTHSARIFVARERYIRGGALLGSKRAKKGQKSPRFLFVWSAVSEFWDFRILLANPLVYLQGDVNVGIMPTRTPQQIPEGAAVAIRVLLYDSKKKKKSQTESVVDRFSYEYPRNTYRTETTYSYVLVHTMCFCPIESSRRVCFSCIQSRSRVHLFLAPHV